MAARKTSSKPTRIWKFVARPADESVILGTPDAPGILSIANRYYNTLVSIERDRFDRFVAVRRAHAPELADAEEELTRIDGEIEDTIRSIKKKRQEHWQATAGEKARLMPNDDTKKLADLRVEQKRVNAVAKEHRAAFKTLLEPAQKAFKERAETLAVYRTAENVGKPGPRTKSGANRDTLAAMLAEKEWSAAWKSIAQSDADALAAAQAARASCQLATGTYLAIEDAVHRAKKDSLPRPPRFRRFTGEGKVVVQLRNMKYAGLLAGSTALTIGPAPLLPGKKGNPARMKRIVMDQSIPRSTRRTIEMTAKFHRVPPEDADVKWAALVVRRFGQRMRYEIQLTLEHASFAEPKRPAGTRATDHVRIGWSKVPGGVCVGSWSDGEVIVPDGLLGLHDHASACNGFADKHFASIKRLLERWMKGGVHQLGNWDRGQDDRSRGMLRRICMQYATFALPNVQDLWQEWKSECLPPGYGKGARSPKRAHLRLRATADLYPVWGAPRAWLLTRGITSPDARLAWRLFTWVKKDEHLLQMAVDCERRFRNRRDAFFREHAIRLATEFAELTVDSYKISDLRELPVLSQPGETPRDIPQHNGQAAAPGRFREILIEVMGPRCKPSERADDEGKASALTVQKKEESDEREDAIVDAAE